MAQICHTCVLFGCRDRGDAAGMAILPEKIETEILMRKLLEDNGLPQPDAVEYGHTCIRLFYNDEKVVLVIDIDEPPEERN